MSRRVRALVIGLLIGALMLAVAIWSAREADGMSRSTQLSTALMSTAPMSAASAAAAAPSEFEFASAAGYPRVPRAFSRWCSKGGRERAQKCRQILIRSSRQAERLRERDRGDTLEWRQLAPRKQRALKRSYKRAWIRRYGRIIGAPAPEPRSRLDWPDCGDWWVPCWREFKFGLTCMFPMASPAMPFVVKECVDQFPLLQPEQRIVLLCGGGLLAGYGFGRQPGMVGPAISCATLYFNWQATKDGTY